MSRIATIFETLKGEGRAALMPYVVAGDPDVETTKRLVLEMEKRGADLLELGVPFSDPIADGPTNQRAAQRALQGGMTVKGALSLVRELREAGCGLGIMLMGYCNPFYVYGLEKFCADAAEAGADGLIVPDLSPEDAGELRGPADAAGLDTVFLIAPTSTPERLDLVAGESRGFVYAVSLTGVTGARDALPPDLEGFVTRAREHVSLPIAVGFGISTPGMARGVGKVADGVIVGSAIVGRIEKAGEEGRDPVPDVAEFVGSLAQALR